MVGGMTADHWNRDPRRLGFVLARYKFVSRMLDGYPEVLEVGCSDGFGTRVVRQKVGFLLAIDIDERAIQEARARQSTEWPVKFECCAVEHLPWSWRMKFSAAFALDVIEHVEPGAPTRIFIMAMAAAAPVVIIGSPSAESQLYASELSRAGHVNCMTEQALREVMEEHFRHVFLFGMNDEVVHTGFGPMCHYRFALGVN